MSEDVVPMQTGRVTAPPKRPVPGAKVRYTALRFTTGRLVGSARRPSKPPRRPVRRDRDARWGFGVSRL